MHSATRLLPAMRRGAWLRYVPPTATPYGTAGALSYMSVRAGSTAAGGSDVAMPFLRPVVGQIAAALRTTACMLPYSAVSEGSEVPTPLLRPSQVVVAASKVGWARGLGYHRTGARDGAL